MQRYFGRPLSHVKIGGLMMDYASLAARHRIRLPRELLLFDKCLIELEGLARVLFPEANILKKAEPYAERLFYERMSPRVVAGEIAGAAGDYRDLLRDLPVDASRIIKKVKDGKLSIEFFHKGLDDFMGTVDRSSNRLAFGIIVAALVVGSSLVLSSGLAPTILGIPVLGIIGFAAASLIGLWLVVQAIRSGRF
jgi:ubiquinone biosynthesis protein